MSMIRVHLSGTNTNFNQREAICVDMEVVYSERLGDVINRIPCPLVEIKVKAIEFLNEETEETERLARIKAGTHTGRDYRDAEHQ